MISSEFVYSSALSFLKNSATFAKAHPVRTNLMIAFFVIELGIEFGGVVKKQEDAKCHSSYCQWAALMYWIPSCSSQWGMPYFQPIALSILGVFGLANAQKDGYNSDVFKYSHLERATGGISKVVNVAIIGFTIAQNYSKNAGIGVATGLGVLSAFNFIKA